MSTPAGRPCRVIKISPSAAKRRYFDRSSLTRARATACVGRAFPFEPGLRLGLGDDGEDFDRCFRNVIEHPDVVDPQAVLRTTQTPQPFDSTLAEFGRLEPEMALDRITNPGPDMRRETPKR